MFGRCVRTDAATVFTLADVLGLRSNSDAIEATRFEVTSLLDCLDIGVSLPFRVVNLTLTRHYQKGYLKKG